MSERLRGVSSRNRTGEMVLIAEDEPLVRNVAVRVLEKAGYSTLTAEDGEEAVRLVEQFGDRISLVLLDVVMPGMTGHQAYARIKELRPDMGIVFCTGYDPEAEQIGFAVRGGLPVLQKPFRFDDLLRTVRRALDAGDVLQPSAT